MVKFDTVLIISQGSFSMTASIINGKIIAESIKKSIAGEIKIQQEQGLSIPGLAVILVGKDPASEIYVHNKRLACQEVACKRFFTKTRSCHIWVILV